MNREIKYRALAVTGEMVYGSYIHSPKNKGCLNEHRIYEHSTGIEHDIIIETIGQFTGLKDIGQDDIYEGDIVLTPTKKMMCISWTKHYASFVLNREGWLFEHYFGEAVEPNEVVIVGNIHQNKELLN